MWSCFLAWRTPVPSKEVSCLDVVYCGVGGVGSVAAREHEPDLGARVSVIHVVLHQVYRIVFTTHHLVPSEPARPFVWNRTAELPCAVPTEDCCERVHDPVPSVPPIIPDQSPSGNPPFRL